MLCIRNKMPEIEILQQDKLCFTVCKGNKNNITFIIHHVRRQVNSICIRNKTFVIAFLIIYCL